MIRRQFTEILRRFQHAFSDRPPGSTVRRRTVPYRGIKLNPNIPALRLACDTIGNEFGLQGCHFSDGGLARMANLWFDKLNSWP